MNLPSDWFQQIQAEYPKRLGHNGWESVRVLVPRLVFTWKEPWERVLKGVQNYRRMCDTEGKTGSGYVMAAKAFFDDRERLVLEYADMDMRTPAEIAEEAKWNALKDRAATLGVAIHSHNFRAAEQIVNDAERDAQQRAWRERGLDAPKFGRAS